MHELILCAGIMQGIWILPLIAYLWDKRRKEKAAQDRLDKQLRKYTHMAERRK